MRNVIATYARAQLLKLLDRVETGESITIMRRGKAVAVLAPAEAVPPKAAPTPHALRPRRKRTALMSEAEILAAANAKR